MDVLNTNLTRMESLVLKVLFVIADGSLRLLAQRQDFLLRSTDRTRMYKYVRCPCRFVWPG